jgi:hypothetical protein
MSVTCPPTLCSSSWQKPVKVILVKMPIKPTVSYRVPRPCTVIVMLTGSATVRVCQSYRHLRRLWRSPTKRTPPSIFTLWLSIPMANSGSYRLSASSLSASLQLNEATKIVFSPALRSLRMCPRARPRRASELLDARPQGGRPIRTMLALCTAVLVVAAPFPLMTRSGPQGSSDHNNAPTVTPIKAVAPQPAQASVGRA